MWHLGVLVTFVDIQFLLITSKIKITDRLDEDLDAFLLVFRQKNI
jgi:hypothetical protein